MKAKWTIFMLFQIMLGMAQTAHLVIPKGHTASITSSCYSPNHKYILTGSRDLTAKLWDLSGHEIQTYKLDNQVQAVAFSPTGDSLLIGSTDGKVTLWKITGEKLATATGHKNFVNAVASSPDGKYMLSGSSDATAKLWDLNGNPIRTFQHAKSVTSVAFSSDGTNIVTGSEDKTAALWNVDGKKIHSFIGHKSSIIQVRISNNQKYILTGSADKSAIVWDRNGKMIKQIIHADKVTACDFNNENNLCVSGSMDGTVKIWKLSGVIVNSFKAHDWFLSSVNFSNDGKTLITTSEDAEEGMLKQWDYYGHQIQNFGGHAQSVNSVNFSKDGNFIITACADNSVKFWDVANYNYKKIQGHKNKITSEALSPNSKMIFTGSEDKTAILWDLSGKKLHTFQLDSKISTVAFSPDGKIILTGCYNGLIKLWDESGVEIKMFKQNTIVTNAVFSQDGKLIATGGPDRMVKVYDLSGNLLSSINVESQINSLLFISNDKSIITGNFNGLVQIWDIASGELTQTLGEPGDEILSVASSIDGSLIATGSSQGAFRLWDLAKKEFKFSNAHSTKVTSVNFSPDGKTVATASADGTVRLWDLSPFKEKLTMVSLDSSDWAVANADGFFDASAGAMQLMYYIVGLEVVELDQLKDRYYEPGLLGISLGIIKDDRQEVSVLTSDALHPELEASISTNELLIKLKERGGGIGKLSLYINGKEVMENANPDKQTALKIDLNSFNKYFFGDSNIISLRAYNNESWLKSQSYDLPYFYIASKGNEGNANQNEPLVFKGKFSLYAIVIGTSDYKGDKLDLKFPDADAKAIANALMLAGSKLFEDRVHIKLLTTNGKTADAISSRVNIESAFKEYAAKATVGDVLVVYFSGHGSTYGYGDAENSQFYYLTKDFASDDLSNDNDRNNFTVSSNDLTRWLTAIPARKQVVIFDACHSGKVVDALQAIGARELSPSQIRAFDRMKDRTGMFVLAGSAADKVSFEASQFGQGLLTYSLLEGISGLALTSDKRVDIATLFQYSRDKVPELAKGINKIQIPVVAFPKGGSSFDIGVVDASVKIPLAQPKPVFIRSTFVDTDARIDSKVIGKAMADYFNAMGSSDADVVYVDVNEYENGYAITGLYNVKNDVINCDCALSKGAAPPIKFQVSGNPKAIPQFVEQIVAKASELIKK